MKYRRWLADEILQGRITREELQALAGRDLVCYCAPKLCHGHALRSAVAWAMKEPPSVTRRTARAMMFVRLLVP